MAPPKQQSKPETTKVNNESPIKNAYLLFYNAISAVAWGIVLARTVSLAGLEGPEAVFPAIGNRTKWTQTAAGLEILHSLLGVVRAPVFTTAMQVASRFLLVWGVVHPFPELAVQSPFYVSMLLAWSLTEVIRYSFFAVGLRFGQQPAFLTWLRYNTFFVLYPVGITSECVLIYLATGPAAEQYGDVFKYGLYAILATYVPGAYILYTYMMKQRKRVMRNLKAKNEKASQ
ncbi:unnamed protein product [Clonostachys chloroleuca]|uniref:Very-long-chain (3R)-3-hydroxyacyl-CoA dehydratase n=1 Tax=Clonostachys chloroleuca TaxID=1926264 RepID=A0AA35M1N6_9HYPO|nr:unnamed protein product [Clonostachys chloroleuca]